MSLHPRYCNSAPRLGIPDPSTVGFSCQISSNYTRLSTCCAPNSVQPYDSDACYNWCHIPSNLTSAYNVSSSPFSSTYNRNESGAEVVWASMRTCLEADGGAPVVLLGCQNNTEQNAPKPAPTSTFDAAAYCATAPPSIFNGPIDPQPGCGLRPGMNNTATLEKCCDWSPVKWSIIHCYEYCVLPRGTEFMGKGNLTVDEAVGSFRACMLKHGGDNVFEGLHCRVNETDLDLQRWNGTTTTWLLGDAVKWSSPMLLVGTCVAGLCLWAIS